MTGESTKHDGAGATDPAGAVVIPFGVPDAGRGLGLGLAALVHGVTRVDGRGVALAQIVARRAEGEAEASAVEAFVPPHAWRELASGGGAPAGVRIVVTGAFEPPTTGPGLLELVAFEPRGGEVFARELVHVDGDGAGKTILGAFDTIWSRFGGDIGALRDIGDLGWEALESVLRAERCVLHDPRRGGPHDVFAAMLHLGRAVEDAPDARYPAGRLAMVALDAALAARQAPSGTGVASAEAALRALTRAAEDAPAQLDVAEAAATIEIALGRTIEAEARASAALTRAPARARLHLLLSEARRARGDFSGARDAIDRGIAASGATPILSSERGVVLAELGHLDAAEAEWRGVLAREPLHPVAFTRLAAATSARGDATAGQILVDGVLAADGAHPEVLRQAIQLALACEPDGVARAARVERLAEVLVERVPGDAWGHLMLARARARTGATAAAIAHLARVERLVPDGAMAAEAQRGRLALENRRAAVEIESLTRAAYDAPEADLDAIAARARTMAAAHDAWTAHVAAGVAERRLARWGHARASFEAAVAVAPGCTPAHVELVAACAALGDGAAALAHARRTIDLEGEGARSLAVLATALLACGAHDEATVVIDRALAFAPDDAANRALAERIRAARERATTPPLATRARAWIGRVFRRS